MLRFVYLLAGRREQGGERAMPVQRLRVCRHCGADVVRARRTFREKVDRRQVYECTQCAQRQSTGGWLWIDTAKHAHCPSCGNFRITVRQAPDKIEPMYRSPANLFKRLLGGTLYRCRHCRLQFYDRRPLRDRPLEAASNSFSYPAGEGPV